VEDAVALAHNAAALSRAMEPPFDSPRAVLEQLSLGEIADWCALYGQFERGDYECGGAAT
jgi:hypothetical protein